MSKTVDTWAKSNVVPVASLDTRRTNVGSITKRTNERGTERIKPRRDPPGKEATNQSTEVEESRRNTAYRLCRNRRAQYVYCMRRPCIDAYQLL